MSPRGQVIVALEQRVGLAFADRELLERALTHSSMRGQGGAVAVNETLEFLGDRVLGLIAAQALMRAFPALGEGELAALHARLVSGAACAEAARAIDLAPALRLAGVRRERLSARVLGDAMEALIAAAFIDGGLEAARALFDRAWAGAMAGLDPSARKDAKTALQEWAMARGLPLPAYAEARSGPAHAPRFEVEARIVGAEPARGEGPSRRAAEQAAAAALLDRLAARSAP